MTPGKYIKNLEEAKIINIKLSKYRPDIIDLFTTRIKPLGVGIDG
jgi:hypothetical protein